MRYCLIGTEAINLTAPMTALKNEGHYVVEFVPKNVKETPSFSNIDIFMALSILPNEDHNHAIVQGRLIGSSKLSNALATDIQFKKDFLTALNLNHDSSKPTDIILTAFFNGNNFMMPFFVETLDERLFAGELGPRTAGEGFTITKRTVKFKLYEMTLELIRPVLRKHPYRGPVSVFVNVSDDGSIIITDLVMGFRRPFLEALLYNLKQPFAQFLQNILNGTNDWLMLENGIMAIARVSTIGYPSDPSAASDFCFSKSDNAKDALDKLHENLALLALKSNFDVQYRTDACKRSIAKIARLRGLGMFDVADKVNDKINEKTKGKETQKNEDLIIVA